MLFDRLKIRQVPGKVDCEMTQAFLTQQLLLIAVGHMA